jgi:hypothetical protein
MEPQAVSSVINDDYSARILIWAVEKGRTASEMSEALGIPISATYNRIRQLEHIGLLVCIEMRLAPSGKRIAVYQSRLKKASIFLDRGEIRVTFELTDGKSEDFCIVEDLDRVRN